MIKTSTLQNMTFKNAIEICKYQWTTSYEKALEEVEKFERNSLTKFISRKSYKCGVNGSKIYWDECTIPFIISRSHERECQHGKDWNKARNEQKRLSRFSMQLSDHHFSNKKKIVRSSKKVNCKAKVIMSEVVKFPEYQIMINSTSVTNYAKSQASKEIRKKLSECDVSLIRKHACRIRFPLAEEHTGHVLKEVATANEDREVTAIDDIASIMPSPTIQALQIENIESDKTTADHQKLCISIAKIATKICNICYDVASVIKLSKAEAILKEVLDNLSERCKYDSGLEGKNGHNEHCFRIKRKTFATTNLISTCDEIPRKRLKLNPSRGTAN
ncbi:uncharacterized protein LOC143445300 [Clavelina lepadiformis]|uniref:uncharacterized protein LOC143445300 n=1 Tax=Clavelina lepadiformis TaxID=159417 RepID=UPI0040432939